MKISIEIEDNKQLDRFIELVNEWERVNASKILMKSMKIRFKYDMKSSGEYEDWKPNCLNINPKRCDRTGEWSFFNILVHEFSHLVDHKFKICKDFKKEFTKKGISLYLTSYAKRCHEPVEELAEIISLYLRNPYLLDLISQKHYLFIKRYFKSTVPCNKEYFLSQYEKYSNKHRLSIARKYGITVSGQKIFKNSLLIEI